MAPDPRAAGLHPQGLDRLRAALQSRIDAGRLPGAVLMVVRRGAVACFDALGRQDPVQGAPMQRDSIFRIYSMTKPIVSVAAMRLVEQGRLLLTEPVARHLPEFADTKVAVEHADGRVELVPPARPMTVHDLLRHTSGLTYEFWPPSAVRRRYQDHDVGSLERTNDEATKLLATLPLMHQPGTVFDYSRSTDVLGRLVEVLTGQPLGAHLRETVFEPLRMPDTGFWVPPAQQSRIAEPFAADPDTGAAVSLKEIRRAMPLEHGGGGLVSTAADYARFLQCLLAGGTLDGVRLLQRRTLQWMTSDHLGALPRRENVLGPGYGFGLGFAVRVHAGLEPIPGSVGAYGWSGAAATHFLVDPAEQLFAVLMVQAPGLLDELGAVLHTLVHAAIDD